MDKKIEVKIYGSGNELFGSCCSKNKKSGSCGGGCNGCSQAQTCFQAFSNLEEFIAGTDIKNNVELKFIEADSKALIENEELRELLKQGYALPFIIIDGIFRYYGGISNKLIYNDVKELIE